MNITRIPQRIEIVFWSTLIRMMKESPRLGYIVQRAYDSFKKIEHLSYLLHLLAWGISGLALGFLVGYLFNILH